MLNEEEYDSDTSDEDYIPEGGVVESEDDGSCDEQLDDIEDNNENDNEDHSKKKRKKKKPGKFKKQNSKKNPLLTSVEEKEVDQESEQKDNVKETKKEEDLWADFLADVDEKPAEKPKAKSINSWASFLDPKKKTESSSDSSLATENKPQATQPSTPTTETAKVKITKVFEFAGEEVRVEEEVDANSIEAKSLVDESKKGSEINKSVGTKRPLGLSSIVGILDSKKKKLSTLEKTKIDWLSFKTSEGIEEEMQGHLKSKHGYLEKKEFLERADLRQFEIEKNMRQNRRSNR